MSIIEVVILSAIFIMSLVVTIVEVVSLPAQVIMVILKACGVLNLAWASPLMWIPLMALAVSISIHVVLAFFNGEV